MSSRAQRGIVRCAGLRSTGRSRSQEKGISLNSQKSILLQPQMASLGKRRILEEGARETLLSVHRNSQGCGLLPHLKGGFPCLPGLQSALSHSCVTPAPCPRPLPEAGEDFPGTMLGL